MSVFPCKPQHEDNVYRVRTHRQADPDEMKELKQAFNDPEKQLEELWKDPTVMTDVLLEACDAQGGSGLPCKSMSVQTDMSEEQRRKAFHLWLTLVRESVGSAIASQMMDGFYTLSCLGGDLLLARETSKAFALNVLQFVHNRLKVVVTTMDALTGILDEVLLKGKVKNSENYIFNNQAFVQWGANYSYAKTHCRQQLLQHAQQAQKTIGDLESEIQKLSADYTAKKITEEGRALFSLCQSACQLFNEPALSMGTDGPSKELPALQDAGEAGEASGRKPHGALALNEADWFAPDLEKGMEEDISLSTLMYGLAPTCEKLKVRVSLSKPVQDLRLPSTAATWFGSEAPVAPPTPAPPSQVSLLKWMSAAEIAAMVSVVCRKWGGGTHELKVTHGLQKIGDLIHSLPAARRVAGLERVSSVKGS